MQLNDVKENISEAFVRLLMAKNRLKIYKSESGDDGVDLTVGPLEENIRKDGKSTFIDSDLRLDIQLKCTTEKKVRKLKSGNYSYGLRVKNYEDIVRKKNKKTYIPLILIVFVLPESETEWLKISDDLIILSKYAFWYYPSQQDTLERSELKDKEDKVQIEIISVNQLDLDFMSIFNIFHGN